LQNSLDFLFRWAAGNGYTLEDGKPGVIYAYLAQPLSVRSGVQLTRFLVVKRFFAALVQAIKDSRRVKMDVSLPGDLPANVALEFLRCETEQSVDDVYFSLRSVYQRRPRGNPVLCF